MARVRLCSYWDTISAADTNAQGSTQAATSKARWLRMRQEVTPVGVARKGIAGEALASDAAVEEALMNPDL